MMIVFIVVLCSVSNTLGDTNTSAIVCGLNEILVDVKTTCPPQSCNLSFTEYLCDPNVNNRTYDPGCDCKKNYLRDDEGNCIFNEDCPNPLFTGCGDFEESCGNDTNDCIDGCKCIENYVRDTNGTCIYIECGYNEIASEVKQTCPPQSCDYNPDKYACKPGPPQPGCNCIEDYLRNSSGVCVPKDQCDSDSDTSAIVCGLNEILVDVKTTCPPQSCNLSFTEYLCDPNVNRTYDPGCDCKKNYLRDNEGNCIFNEDCPNPLFTGCSDFKESCGNDTNDCIDGCKCIENYVRDTNGTCIYIECGYNEIASEVKQTCPPQSCDYCPDKYACKPGPPQPGCNCIEDYLRDSSGVCVPKDQCDSDSDDNIVTPKIKVNYHSKSSAHASSSSSSASSSSSSSVTISPTNVTNTNDDLKCNGDRNASFYDCPNPCKSSCKNPNAKPCRGQCESSGCQCNPLYLLSDEGKCILPDDCPGGNPCLQNETFIFCNAGCPTNYCPQNDNRAMVACSPPYPCPSGCGCKSNYKRLSTKDDRCILASDCPPVNCTRQNEVWNSCPPPCFSESCQDVDAPAQECVRSGPNCEPQCVCEDGYRRNKRGVCVLVAECSTEE